MIKLMIVSLLNSLLAKYGQHMTKRVLFDRNMRRSFLDPLIINLPSRGGNTWWRTGEDHQIDKIMNFLRMSAVKRFLEKKVFLASC
jgi:hypothetical protein